MGNEGRSLRRKVVYLTEPLVEIVDTVVDTGNKMNN